jgi:hypothetical protein
MNKDATAEAIPAKVSKASPIDSPREKYTVSVESLAKMVQEGVAADVILFGSGRQLRRRTWFRWFVFLNVYMNSSA